MCNNHVIDKIYDFSDNNGIETSVHIQLDHDSVMDLAESFVHNEDYYEIDNYIKDYIDEVYAKDIALNLYEQWKDNREITNYDTESEKTIENFYDEAWEYLGESVQYYIWPESFKWDCLEYYRRHIQQ